MENQTEQSKHFITYCVMDTDAGANLFGHAFLFLSKRHDDGSIEVLNTLGYYSQPTSTTQPVVKFLKNILGVKYDLQEVHGQLRHEKMREINHNGLQGLSFSLTQEQFEEQNQKFSLMVNNEQQTIEHLNKLLELRGQPQNGFTRRQLLKEIREDNKTSEDSTQQKTIEEINILNQPLQDFHLQLDFGLLGPDTRKSYTCKDRALQYLLDEKIIDEDFKKQFKDTYRGLAPFPCSYGVKLYPIRLQATGNLQTFTSRSGKTFYNPQFAFEGEAANQLWWVNPPVERDQKDPTPKLKPLVIETLNYIKKIQEDLYKQKDEKFKPILESLDKKIGFFTNPSKIQDLGLKEINQFLNAVNLEIHPEYRDASFLLRVYHDANMRHALKALAVLSLCIGYIVAGPILGITVSALTTLSYIFAALSIYFGAKHTYEFFKTEANLAQMKKDHVVVLPTLYPNVPAASA